MRLAEFAPAVSDQASFKRYSRIRPRPGPRRRLQDELDGQQRDDAEGDRAGGQQHAQKLKNPDQTTARFAGIEWV